MSHLRNALRCGAGAMVFFASGTAFAGESLYHSGWAERGLIFDGDIACSTLLGLGSPSSGFSHGPNGYDSAEWDNVYFGTFSIDGWDMPEYATYNFDAFDGGANVTIPLDLYYDATGCGDNSSINVDIYYESWSGGTGDTPILIASPIGMGITDYTMHYNTSLGGSIPAPGSPYPLDAMPGIQGESFDIGVHYSPSVASGWHMVSTRISAYPSF